MNLLAETPHGWEVILRLAGQEVASLPVEANRSESLSFEAKPQVADKEYLHLRV